MRKYLIAALAATTVLAVGTTAVAQAPEATMSVKTSPTKAGTKKKPKSEKLQLTVTNNNTKRTASAANDTGQSGECSATRSPCRSRPVTHGSVRVVATRSGVKVTAAVNKVRHT